MMTESDDHGSCCGSSSLPRPYPPIRRSLDARGKRKRDVPSIILHRLFSGRHRHRSSMSTILPVASVLISVALCLPVLMVGNFDGKSLGGRLRKFRGKVGSMRVMPSRPSSRRAFAEEESFEIPAEVLGSEGNYYDATGDGDAMQAPPGERLPSAAAALVGPAGPDPFEPYSLSDVLRTLPYFHDTFAVLVYDPPTDKFVAHYSDNMRWISGCHKLVTSVKATAHSLRLLFPDRFNPQNGADEFALAISSADYPGINWNECLLTGHTDCIPEKLSPILQFGSVFRRPLVPTMVAMPMPQMNHLSCYHMWAMHGQVCEYYLPRGPGNPDGLVFGENLGLGYDDLIPQVVWRGTDFSYLHKMEPNLRAPNFELDVMSQADLSGRVDKRTAATAAMRQVYDELVPRWKGVVWTAEAEREAERANNEMNRKNKTKRRGIRESDEALPWCNIKFAGAMYMGQKTQTLEIEGYLQFNEHGIPAAGEGMSLEELGRYKYHIDLGGGGGTTWSGTVEKLGLPGLLFHHVTPTKDYLHDRLEAWVHYVPVRADLSDLREKYDWAEAHPAMAKRISDNASEFARSLGTPEGFGSMFEQFYGGPLRRAVESYRPLRDEDGAPSTWREAVESAVGDELRPIMSCAGYYHHDCERLTDDLDFTRLHDRDVDASAR